MSDYKLYCFGESGNAYKAALFFALAGIDWQAVAVDFFNGETRSETYRQTVNAMGEVPVLVHGDVTLTQSGVILDYLSEQTGKFGPSTPEERREVMRWMFFDNHKFTSYLATLRFLLTFMKTGETPVTEFLRARAQSTLGIVDGHLAGQPFIAADRLTIADLSLAGYVFYEDELGLDIGEYANITAWKDRLRGMPGWTHPYDLMPRSYKAG